MRIGLSLALLVSTQIFAGIVVGNSGYGVVCKNADQSESVELYDYYEFSKKYPESNWLVPPKGIDDEYQAALWALKNARRLGVKSAELLIKNFSAVIENIEFVEDPLALIYDVGRDDNSYPDDLPYVYEKQCRLVQLAIQDDEVEFKIKIDRFRYDQLSFQAKVGLLLHEVVYAHAAYRFQNHRVRLYTSVISSDLIEEFSSDIITRFVDFYDPFKFND